MKNNTRITTGILGLALVCLTGGLHAQMSGNGGNGHDDSSRIMQRPAAKTVTAAPAKSGGLSAQDSQFVSEAAKGGMMEVAGGKEAAKKGQSADVKSFGNRMVTDHSKANGELKSIAAGKGVKLPGSSSAPKWSGDKAYMDMMVSDHEKDLSEFKTEASKGSDPQLKAFASKTSKVIAEHLKMAKQIDGKLK